MLVRAPASSANLGPGFDSLALALDLPFWLAVGNETAAPGAGTDRPDADESGDARTLLDVEPAHPAAVAFRAAGGDAGVRLGWRSPIPPGRGLGFSGAARVAGAYAGARSTGQDLPAARATALAIATDLEGHPDNAAASTLGSMTVSAGGVTLSLPVPDRLEVALWWPDTVSGTDASRSRLPTEVPLGAATGSIGRAALWVAAVTTGRLDALRAACEDALHQPSRLAAMPPSAEALAAFLSDRRVLAAWLSGSGPTVAALVADTADMPEVDLPPGSTAVAGIDGHGVGEVDAGGRPHRR